MTQALWGVLLLSLATSAPGESDGANTRSAEARTPDAASRVVAAAGVAESRVQPAKDARPTGKTSESYKAGTAR
ncbi:MAG TPA: hypothetical protein VKZ48_04655 [Burkholderiales bacterium]|nr:hypothetical protein [Burkholderiales bacterium]